MNAREIVAFALDLDIEEISDEDDYESLTCWDSMNHLKIIIKIEEVLGRPCNEDEIEATISVKAIKKLIKEDNG